MPGGDGTGPMGMGPMTGRAAGYCAGAPAAGFMNPGFGRGFGGFGRGFGGRGRGWRHWFYATGLPRWARAGWVPAPGPAAYTSTLPREEELEALETQAEYFNKALEEIRQRLEELRSAKQDPEPK